MGSSGSNPPFPVGPGKERRGAEEAGERPLPPPRSGEFPVAPAAGSVLRRRLELGAGGGEGGAVGVAVVERVAGYK